MPNNQCDKQLCAKAVPRLIDGWGRAYLLTTLIMIGALLAIQAEARSLPNYVDLVAENAPAVVNITSIRKQEQTAVPDIPDHEQLPDFFKYFFRNYPYQQRQPTQSFGSGFIISGDGYIVTNAHVVGEADEVRVRLNDRREMMASVVGQDVRTDIALLKVAAKNLPAVKLGSTQNLKVGQWVLAIGSPFGFDHSATQGIISALSRSLPDGNYVPFIQTDVAVNPGNSGGPLFNTDGEVIGVNSQIYTRSGGFMGLSFAIPIDVVKNVTDQLKENGRVTRGWLGVYIQDMDQALAESFGLKRPRGALVSQVSPNSPAEKADLQAGDVILQFNDKEIIRSGDLPPAVGAVPAGETATLSILRDGKNLEVRVKIGELPDDRAPKPKAKAKDENSRLGVTATDLTDEQRKELDISGGRGVVATQVEPGSAADQAGIEIGDIILTFNKENVKSVKQLQEQIQGAPVDKPIQVLINREGQARFLVVKLKGQ